MWGSIPALETVASIAFWVVTISGAIAVLAGAALTVANDRVTTLTKMEADLRINQAKQEAADAIERAAEANKQAEEAKAETAKTNERLQKSQEMRRLSKDQADRLKPLLTSELFQADPKPTLRVSSVADAESESFALEIQNFLASCGVNVYPTNRGMPSGHVQLVEHPTGLGLGVKSLEPSTYNQPFTLFQHEANAVGFEMRAELNPEMSEREAMIYVMRKPAV